MYQQGTHVDVFIRRTKMASCPPDGFLLLLPLPGTRRQAYVDEYFGKSRESIDRRYTVLFLLFCGPGRPPLPWKEWRAQGRNIYIFPSLASSSDADVVVVVVVVAAVACALQQRPMPALVRIGSVDVRLGQSEENLMDYSLSKSAPTMETVEEVMQLFESGGKVRFVDLLYTVVVDRRKTRIKQTRKSRVDVWRCAGWVY